MLSQGRIDTTSVHLCVFSLCSPLSRYILYFLKFLVRFHERVPLFIYYAQRLGGTALSGWSVAVLDGKACYTPFLGIRP